jgi:hypothetical protein
LAGRLTKQKQKKSGAQSAMPMSNVA